MKGFAIPAALLREMASEDGAPDVRPIPEAQIATLREAFERYEGKCPYKPGDLVTPRKGFGYSDAGVPHIVLEVLDVPLRTFDTNDLRDTGTSVFGAKLDMRVAVVCDDGVVAAFWQESWRHEPYTGPGSSS